MKAHAPLACLLVLALLAPVRAQQQPAPSQQPVAPAADEDVVRITTNLVQLDLVVTDRNGRQVTDLRPSDFEILEDGRPQQITHFNYVNAAPAEAATVAPPVDKSAPPAGNAVLRVGPPARVSPRQVRRTIALIVDDLGMSFESIVPLREVLRRFVAEQVRAGDLVAIIRTGGDVGALQQFTNDQRQLFAAVERVRWNQSSRRGIHIVAPVRRDTLSVVTQTPSAALSASNSVRDTINAIKFVMRGMSELPGRKSVVIFSDSIPGALMQEDGSPISFGQLLHNLADLAVRNSIVVYGIDTRGLPTLSFSAMDATGGLSQGTLNDIVSARHQDIIEGRVAATDLARQTGGFMIRNTNDIAGGLRQVIEDQRGYYLVGYHPAGATFDRRYHRITARVRRPGLTVRTRRGFFGISDEQVQQHARTPREQAMVALMSPFGASVVRLQLSALFEQQPAARPAVRARLHVDAHDLTFKAEPDGWQQCVVEVSGILFGDNGAVAGEYRRTHTVRLRGETYERTLRDGLDYTFELPVKSAGAYQLRAAVRDEATGRLGAAGQFVEVPNLGNGRLALSGPVVAGPGARAIRRPATLDYSFVVYNARPDKATGQPRLTAQARLYRDGQEVFAGPLEPLDAARPLGPKRLTVAGRLPLGASLAPGDYVLEIVVTDALAGAQHRTAIGWLDFEIVE